MFRLRSAVVLLIVLLSLLATNSVGFARATVAIPVVLVTVSDEGVAFSPSEISAGITTLVFDNVRAESPAQGLIARFREGVTKEDLLATAGDPLARVQLLHLYGGMDVPAGTSRSVIVDLKPGTHVLLGFGSTPTFFDVSAAATEGADEPVADVTLAMVDFAFGTPSSIPAGEKLWHIQNVGQQFHEVVMIKIDEGTTLGDAAALIAAVVTPTGQLAPDSPAELVFLWPPMDPGENAWIKLDLDPGTYAIGCVLPDLTLLPEMHTHLEHGMIRIFTVE